MTLWKGKYDMKKIKRFLLRHLGVIHNIHAAELEIIEEIHKLNLGAETEDNITDICFTALKKIT